MARHARPRSLTAHTLGFHCTPKMLANMHAYVWEFSEAIQNEWDRLGEVAQQTKKNLRKASQGHFLIPYSIVTIVLQQLTGGYVHLDKRLRFMVTLEPIDRDDLKTVFTYLEGICHGTPLADIPFSTDSQVAALVSATEPQLLPLAEHILQEDAGVPDPPNWAYKAIKWLLAIKLAGKDFLDYPMEPVKVAVLNEDGTPALDKKGRKKERTKSWERGKDPATITYQPMSTGELIAWNNPIGPAFTGHGHPLPADAMDTIATEWPSDAESRDLEYAMSYLSTKMVTYPAFPKPVMLFDAHIRRVNDVLIYSKTTMVKLAEGKPIITLPLQGRGAVRGTNRHALDILAVLEADRSALRAVDEYVDHERKILEQAAEAGRPAVFTVPPPGNVRPIVPKKRTHAVGDGAGMHKLRMLEEHVKSVFGDAAEPLVLKSNGNAFSPRTFEQLDEEQKKEKAERKKNKDHKGKVPFIDTFGLPSPASVQASVAEAGYRGLRFVCLWYRHPTRIRMLNALAHMYGRDPDVLDSDPKKPTPLAKGIDVVFRQADDFLRHGTDIDRTRQLEILRASVDKEGWLLAAWCETEMPHAETESAKSGARAKATKVTQELGTSDAKFQTRRALSAAGTPSQYLIGAERKYKRKSQRTEGQPAYELKTRTVPGLPWEDHPAFMGLLDLHRSIGVVDHRFEEALYGPDDPYQIPRMAFCGIHIRKQQANRRFRGQPQRIITASCLVPAPTSGGPWRHIAWTNLDPEGRWRNYNEAQTLFHSFNYPLHSHDGAEDAERWAQAGRDVRDALQKLPNKLRGLPYALIVDGHACRRAWPGLHNNKQASMEHTADDRLWTPTQGLGTHPISIIRMNCHQEEMPRLAYVTETKKDGTERMINTSSELYCPEERPEGHPWFLFTEPRNYGKKRYGQYSTRWRAELAKKNVNGDYEENEMNSPWYSMTTREINPMYTQSEFDRESLAVAAARLSHQALAWCDRTRYPASQHAALQMDLDHPQYRRSAPEDDPEQQRVIAEASGGKAGTT